MGNFLVLTIRPKDCLPISLIRDTLNCLPAQKGIVTNELPSSQCLQVSKQRKAYWSTITVSHGELDRHVNEVSEVGDFLL